MASGALVPHRATLSHRARERLEWGQVPNKYLILPNTTVRIIKKRKIQIFPVTICHIINFTVIFLSWKIKWPMKKITREMAKAKEKRDYDRKSRGLGVKS